MKDERYVIWNLQVTKNLDKALNKAVEVNAHNTKSEFIRDAVRRELQKRKMLFD